MISFKTVTMKNFINSIIAIITTALGFIKDIFVKEKAVVNTDSIFEQTHKEAIEAVRNMPREQEWTYPTAITELHKDILLWSHDHNTDVMCAREYGTFRNKVANRFYRVDCYVNEYWRDSFIMECADYWQLEMHARKITGDPMDLGLDVYWVIDPLKQKLITNNCIWEGNELNPEYSDQDFVMANDTVIVCRNASNTLPELFVFYDRKTFEEIGRQNVWFDHQTFFDGATLGWESQCWVALPTRGHYERICSEMNTNFGAPDRDFKHGYRWNVGDRCGVNNVSLVYIWDHTDCENPYIECKLVINNVIEKQVKLTTAEDCESFHCF